MKHIVNDIKAYNTHKYYRPLQYKEKVLNSKIMEKPVGYM